MDRNAFVEDRRSNDSVDLIGPMDEHRGDGSVTGLLIRRGGRRPAIAACAFQLDDRLILAAGSVLATSTS